MSEFKFACPVCGQHITVDSSTSGGQIACPTCFRKIVVPQAPSSTDSNLIISAAQADKPKPPISSTAELDPFHTPVRKSFPFAATLLVLLCLAGATAFVFRGKIFKTTASPAHLPTNSLAKKTAPRTIYPIPTNINWTLDLTNVAFPETIAAGKIRDSGFRCERAILQGGSLTLRQGKSGPADLGITVHLFAQQGEELGGKSIEVASDRVPPLPKVVLLWKDNQDKTMRQTLNQGYAMKLAFGEVLDGRIPGRIYISLPDEFRSVIAGTFTADIRKPPPPKPKQPKTPQPAKKVG